MKKRQKPKVLLDAFHLYNALTGIKTFTLQLYEGLEESEELSCDYLIYPNWRKATNSQFLKGKLGVVKKLIHHSSFLLYKQFFFPLYAWVKGVDIIVSLDFVLPRFKMGKKSFVVIYDVFFWELRDNYPKAWRSYFTSMVESGITKDTVLISISHHTSGKIREYITDKNPIEVVYLSPKLLDKTEDEELVLKEMNLSSGSYFFHVGLLDKRKNLLTLIKAFARYVKMPPTNQMKLVLAGERGIGKAQDVYSQILSLMDKYDLRDRILLPGFVSNHQLGVLYRNSFAYIFPSYDEGFGIPVLEAFHSKVPVIVSDRGSLMEVAEGAALVFDADDDEGLCNEMMKLGNRELREQLINKGTERLKSFSKSKFAASFDDAIAKHVALKDS